MKYIHRPMFACENAHTVGEECLSNDYGDYDYRLYLARELHFSKTKGAFLCCHCWDMIDEDMRGTTTLQEYFNSLECSRAASFIYDYAGGPPGE